MASRSENRDKQRTAARGAAKSPAKAAGGGDAKPADGPNRSAKAASASRSSAKTASASRPAAKTPSTSRAAAKSASGPRAGGKASSPSRSAARGARSEEREKPVAKAVKGEDKTAERISDGAGTGMNREMKRMMQKREGAADRLKRPTAPKAKRTKPLTFLKEVRGELGRVAWPTRQEVITYSLVVVVTVTFFMIVIYGIDFVALKGVLWLIDRGGR